MNSTPEHQALETPVLEFQEVSFSFEDTAALSDVTFQLQRGQMIVVTGVSGSGKSVLLHLAIGLFRPDKGRILIEGREIGQLGETELLAIRSQTMGFAFQQDTLFTGISVYDNTAYRLDEHGWSEADTDRAVREILGFVGLEDHVDKLPEELSIGMRRRLEIARALVGWPRIMLFDEPTSGLDPINARLVLDLILQASDIHQISLICTTKEMKEIQYLATQRTQGNQSRQLSAGQPETKVMVLEDGKIAFTGSFQEFQASESPAIMRVTARAEAARVTDSHYPDPWRKRQGSAKNPLPARNEPGFGCE